MLAVLGSIFVKVDFFISQNRDVGAPNRFSDGANSRAR
jgi:hypothetical protein